MNAREWTPAELLERANQMLERVNGMDDAIELLLTGKASHSEQLRVAIEATIIPAMGSLYLDAEDWRKDVRVSVPEALPQEDREEAP